MAADDPQRRHRRGGAKPPIDAGADFFSAGRITLLAIVRLRVSLVRMRFSIAPVWS